MSNNSGSGCVIVDGKGKIVAKSGNRNIPLGHAVMAAISDLCERHRTKQSKFFISKLNKNVKTLSFLATISYMLNLIFEGMYD